jgi:hypothetical protein
MQCKASELMRKQQTLPYKHLLLWNGCVMLTDKLLELVQDSLPVAKTG